MSSTEAMQEASLRPENREFRQAAGHFAKGVSGNPGGRPKKEVSLTDTLRTILENRPQELVELAESMILHAKQGNGVVSKQVWDRLDGTVTERSETLLKHAEQDQMNEDALLIAADRIRAMRAEKQGSTFDVEAPLPSNGTPNMGSDSEAP